MPPKALPLAIRFSKTSSGKWVVLADQQFSDGDRVAVPRKGKTPWRTVVNAGYWDPFKKLWIHQVKTNTGEHDFDAYEGVQDE